MRRSDGDPGRVDEVATEVGTGSADKVRAQVRGAGRKRGAKPTGGQPMTLERFREIMGTDLDGLGDEQIGRIMRGLDGLADIVCDVILTKPAALKEAS
jgi:hypothetical protein